MHSIYIYKKYYENDEAVKEIIEAVRNKDDAVYSVTEHSFSYHELDSIIDGGTPGTIIATSGINDLGTDTADASRRITRISRKKIVLILASVPATYEHGISSSVNGIALETLCQIIGSGASTQVIAFRKRQAGRPRMEFPEGWDEKYADWKSGRISSRDFMEWSGMKKATFYNRITEYKRILDEEEASTLSKNA